MKKIFLFILTIFLAYITAFYTTGKKNGYTEMFDSDITEKISKLFYFEDEITVSKTDFLSEGKRHLENKEYSSALNDFAIASAENNSSEVNYLLGHTYLLLEDYSSSEIYLNDAIRLNAENIKAYIDRGYAKYMQSKNNDAINDLFFATEIDPTNPKAYYYLSLCYEQAGKLEVALQSVETALKYDKNYVDARFKAGYIAYDIDNFSLSVNHYLKLLKTDSLHKFGTINLGLAYSQIGKDDSAMFYYDKVIENYPKYYLAYNNKGYIYQKRNQYQKAIEFYNLAYQLKPSDTYSLWNRGDCFFELKEYQKAINDYKKVYELKSDYYNVLNSIGDCYEKLNMKSKALEYYSKFKEASGS